MDGSRWLDWNGSILAIAHLDRAATTKFTSLPVAPSIWASCM
jgi:hypothetical protein